MLSRDQAEWASEAVLEPERRRLARKQERKRQREAFWQAHAQKADIGLLGLALGSHLGYYAVGDLFPWNLIGLGLGFGLAVLARRLGIPLFR
ncbi:hypothetical protein ACMDCT_04595 [Halomonadaceae bacterium KBTZ08]